MNDITTTKKTGVQQKELFHTEGLSRRGQPKYKVNPFVDDGLITQLSGQKNVYYSQNTSNALIDTKTGEIEPAKLTIIKKVRTDKEQFVKLYTTHLKAFFELSTPAFKTLQYVLHVVQNEAINKDKIYLSLTSAQDFFIHNNSKISSTAYYKSMKELVEKLFIAETLEINIYFINPKLFFNGDRVEFLTQFHIDDKPMKVEELNIKPNIDI